MLYREITASSHVVVAIDFAILRANLDFITFAKRVKGVPPIRKVLVKLTVPLPFQARYFQFFDSVWNRFVTKIK